MHPEVQILPASATKMKFLPVVPSPLLLFLKSSLLPLLKTCSIRVHPAVPALNCPTSLYQLRTTRLLLTTLRPPPPSTPLPILPPPTLPPTLPTLPLTCLLNKPSLQHIRLQARSHLPTTQPYPIHLLSTPPRTSLTHPTLTPRRRAHGCTPRTSARLRQM